MRILLVDDEDGIREGLAGLLRLKGHEVRTAATIDAGRELLGACRFELAITDWRLPDGNADLLFAACELPVIAVSGHPEWDWQFTLFENPEPNAFALPGGKVGVYTGLFKVAKNDDQLAAVIRPLEDRDGNPAGLALRDGLVNLRSPERLAKPLHLQAKLCGVDAEGTVDGENEGKVDFHRLRADATVVVQIKCRERQHKESGEASNKPAAQRCRQRQMHATLSNAALASSS